MASKTIYIYKDISKPGYYKIGKADIRAGFNEQQISAEEIAYNRINEQRSAGVNSDWSFVYVFDVSNCELTSLEIEKYIHKKLNRFVIPINKNLSGDSSSVYNSEWFNLKTNNDDKVISLVDKFIKNKTKVSAKKSYELRSYQKYIKDNFITKYNEGFKAFTLELCPRFGKTIWLLDLFDYFTQNNDFNYLILPTYILSSNYSFKKEIAKYKQFDEFIFVDDKNPDFFEIIKNKKKIIIGLSLHVTYEKNVLITNAINQLTFGKKMIVIDESDQGTCTVKKQLKVDNINRDLYIDMSGTGMGKILNLKHSGNNTCAIRFSYSEILLVKNNLHPDIPNCSSLDDIPVPYMYRLTIPNGCWKNNLMNQLGLDVSWSKLLGSVKANELILQDLLEALFLKNERNQFDNKKSILSKLSLDNRENFTRCDVCMIFANFRNNSEFNEFIRIAKNTLKRKYEILKINGESATNASAEEIVRNKIDSMKENESSKRLIIVSKNMAARSFSIPEIDTVFLMYDRGSKDQTTQKFSRANTPGVLFDGSVKKCSSIVSLSFDNNRKTYDVFDDLIINEIKNNQKNGESIQDVIKRLHNCWNIFYQNDCGDYIHLNEDEYSKILLNASKTKDVFKSLVDINMLFEMISKNDILGTASKSKISIQENDIDISKVKTIQRLKNYHDTLNQKEKIIDNVESFKLHLSFLLDHIEELTAFNNFKSDNIYDILDEIIHDDDSAKIIDQIEMYYKLKFSFIIKAILTNNFPVSIINTVIKYKNNNFNKYFW